MNTEADSAWTPLQFCPFKWAKDELMFREMITFEGELDCGVLNVALP